MELLESYLRAVKRYLPRAQSSDIIRELSDELRSQFEEKESVLGRPMTDEEIVAFLKQHGDPMTVARRYRQDSPSLTVGWELIGPELFPMYLIFLSVNLVITVAAVAIVTLAVHLPITLQTFVFPAVIQIGCVTLAFVVMNVIRRKCPQPWYYPPAEVASMMPIKRGYSVSGLILWVPVLLWWLALPHFPYLILGSAAEHLKLAPSWHSFYVPILLLVLVSISQRVLNLFYPERTWLLPVMRLVINAASVPVLYFLVFKSQPLVVVSDPFLGVPQYDKLAQSTNGSLVWGVFGPWLWCYAGIGALVYAWYCRPHLRRLLRGKSGESSSSVSQTPR
ncbi:MAG TPA: hypothetical protein VJO16_06185 [Candidatus Acidoferrum sp.]|nr:hypothetical protein [Candidatus Acidoferrum sp.]